MSQIHKVIILNKPLKIFDFTPVQLIIMLLCIVGCLILSSKIPPDWKLDKMPMGFLIPFVIFCLALVFVKGSELKPARWWLNLFLYRLNLATRVFLPHPEPSQIYPDPDIIDAKKRDDNVYVQAD